MATKENVRRRERKIVLRSSIFFFCCVSESVMAESEASFWVGNICMYIEAYIIGLVLTLMTKTTTFFFLV